MGRRRSIRQGWNRRIRGQGSRGRGRRLTPRGRANTMRGPMRTSLRVLLYSVIFLASALPSFAQQPATTAKPDDTEVWTPVPRVVTPGRHRSRPAVRRHRPVRRQEPRRVGRHEGQVARALEGRRRRHHRQQDRREHRDEAPLHELPAAHRMAHPVRHHRHRSGARQQRRRSSPRPVTATRATSSRSSTRTTTRRTSTARPARSTSSPFRS